MGSGHGLALAQLVYFGVTQPQALQQGIGIFQQYDGLLRGLTGQGSVLRCQDIGPLPGLIAVAVRIFKQPQALLGLEYTAHRIIHGALAVFLAGLACLWWAQAGGATCRVGWTLGGAFLGGFVHNAYTARAYPDLLAHDGELTRTASPRACATGWTWA